MLAPPPDAALEQRVNDKVGVLVDRVNFLAETAGATAGKLAATDGELNTFQQRSTEALTKLERRSDEALARTEGALRAMRGDLEAFTQLVEIAFPRLEGIAYLILRDADRAAQQALAEADPAYGRVVCRCELVTEGEVVE